MKVLDAKLNETSVKFYDDFAYNSNKSENVKNFENMLSLVLFSLTLVK